jgi:hypothetical protein
MAQFIAELFNDPNTVAQQFLAAQRNALRISAAS